MGVIQKLLFGSCFVSLKENRLALLCKEGTSGTVIQLQLCNGIFVEINAGGFERGIVTDSMNTLVNESRFVGR